MLTGELRSQIDSIWNAFWSGGISNPLEVMEQITYLLFLRRLDEMHTLEENKSQRLGKPMERRIYPEGNDVRGRDYNDLRWSRFKHFAAGEMFNVIGEHVFPFLRSMGGDDSTYAHHMKDARFTIPTPALLAKVVDLLDHVPMEDRDTKGDLYEYMLGKIASAGQNGQFRTPRHIIQLMVELTAPTAKDVICDPASGTCGFLVAAGEYLREKHPEILRDATSREHFHHGMFHGYDVDNTMLRIGSMNMALHGVDNPDIRYKDSLAQDHAGDEEKYSLILANPPFAGSLDYENTAKDLQAMVKTKKTELLFLALFLRLLKPGGRAAVIVPDGVLFGSSKAHKQLRQMLVEEQKLDAVISLPSGCFKPYAGVSTAILLFTKTNSGGTDNVWFYDMKADGWSLDDKRQPLLPEDKLGLAPLHILNAEEHAKNNLPDVQTRWKLRDSTERQRARTEQSFCVSKTEIAAADYDLSIQCHKVTPKQEMRIESPQEIVQEIKRLTDSVNNELHIMAGLVPNYEFEEFYQQHPLVPLISVCKRVTDGTHQSPKWSSDGHPFLFVSNIVSGQIDFSTEKHISDETFIELTRRCPIEVGDILYSTLGSYGIPSLVREQRKFAFQRHIAHIKPDQAKILPEYLCLVLGSPQVRRQADKAARGIAQKTINLAELKQFQISLPPFQKQHDFVHQFSVLQNLISCQSLALEKLRNLSEFVKYVAYTGVN